MLSLQSNDLAKSIPHVDEYFGVWAMHEPQFNALKQHAENINVQLHLQAVAAGANAADIKARDSRDYDVTADGVAIIPVTGTIMKHTSSMSSNTSTVATRRKVRAAASDDAVKAIMIVVDSPGGTVKGIHDLAEDINAARGRKPVWSYVEDLAASGGYWIASQSDRLLGNSAAVVGSIGVFNVVYDMSKAAENEGIKVHVVKAGEFKGTAIPGTEVTEPQLAEMQRMVNAYYTDFINAISSGRRMPTAEASALADGRIHKGQEAVALKLLDELMTFDQALTELANVGRSQAVTSTRKTKMSNQTQADAATAEPTAATIGELKKKCPKASSEFILAQLEKKATLAEAMDAYIEDQEARIAVAEKARDEAEKAATKAMSQPAQPARNKPGVKALSEDGSEESSSDAERDLQAMVRKEMAAKPGMLMRHAYAAVYERHPDLRESVIASSPVSRRSERR